MWNAGVGCSSLKSHDCGAGLWGRGNEVGDRAGGVMIGW